MEHTTGLALYSQTTRLDHSLHGSRGSEATGLSPSWMDHSRSLRLRTPREGMVDSLHCELEVDPASFSVGYSGFARRYSRNLCWFLFLQLMICLSSLGSRAPVHWVLYISQLHGTRRRKLSNGAVCIRSEDDLGNLCKSRLLTQFATTVIVPRVESSTLSRWYIRPSRFSLE